MEWAGHVARNRGKKNAYGFLAGIYEIMAFLGIGLGRKSILESGFNETSCEGEYWIQMARNRFCKGLFKHGEASVVVKDSRECIV
jgi:hypothetical protein